MPERQHAKSFLQREVRPGCFFFCCGPFLLVPRVIGFYKIFCCRPRVCKVFFFFCCAPLGAATFRRGQSKKKKHPGCFFFAPAPGKGRGRRSPVPTRGQSKKKKHHPGCFFFGCGPGERQGKEKPRWALARGQSKKKNTAQGVFFFLLRPRGKAGEGEAPCRHGARAKKKTPPRVFFLLRPRRKAREGEAPLGAGTGPEQKKQHHPGFFFFAPAPGKGRGRRSPVGRRHGAIFFLLWPRAGAQRGFSFPCLSPGPEQKKNTLGGVFFFALAPCRRPTGLLLPLPFAGAAAKKKNTLGGVFFLLWPRAGTGLLLPCLSPGPEQKKTPWVVFFFLLRPRADAHSLTAGLGGDASPSPGWCFLFAAAPPGPGWCFFFAVAPPGRSLTHCGLGRFRQGPGGVFFFVAAPPGLFRQ